MLGGARPSLRFEDELDLDQSISLNPSCLFCDLRRMFPVLRFVFTSAGVFYGLVGIKTQLSYDKFEQSRSQELRDLQAEIARLRPV